MKNKLFLHSLSNLREIILPALEMAGARRIVEIGSEYGTFTQDLFAYATRMDGRLTTIDPAPQPAARKFMDANQNGLFQFIQATSIEALATLEPADAYIIDGDHNYYTVLRELELIHANAKNRPWLVFQHDVCWPCARRDMYYNTSQIPPEFLHPHTYNHAIAPGDQGLRPAGGFRGDGTLAFANHEGGPRNGVTTAIEDFVAQHPELQFDVVTAVFGLGIIHSKKAPWAAQFAAHLKPYVNSYMLQRMEENRVTLYSKVMELQEEVDRLGALSEVMPGAHPLEVFRVADKNTFLRAFGSRLRPAINQQHEKLPATSAVFALPGYCVVCRKAVSLRTDFEFASPDEKGRLIPAWREKQVCECRLNCRLRSSFHFLKDLLGLPREAAIYVTEQHSLLFQQIRAVFPRAIGSENLGNSIPLGGANAQGIRNENAEKLSFADASLDCVFGLDRLQCVPDHRQALREMARCLRLDGQLLLTVPFCFDRDQSFVRAEKDPSGVKHHVPPTYHHDPANPKGALSYHDFGWDLLTAIEESGFDRAELVAFTAPHFGYVGMQYVIRAVRSTKATVPAAAVTAASNTFVSGRMEELATA